MPLSFFDPFEAFRSLARLFVRVGLGKDIQSKPFSSAVDHFVDLEVFGIPWVTGSSSSAKGLG